MSGGLMLFLSDSLVLVIFLLFIFFGSVGYIKLTYRMSAFEHTLK